MINGLLKIDVEGHPSYLNDKLTITNYMGAIIKPEVKQKVIPLLKSTFGKISEREMAMRLGIGKTAINRWCRELGLFPVKHTANENIFDKLDENSAYLLGYIFTDGNVAWNPKKSYRSLTITASEKDMSHLEKLREILSSTKPLLYSSKTKSYRLIVVSKKLSKKLMKLGVMPRKSLIVDFPKVSKTYLRHFIRGVVDGDGSVRYVDRERSPYFELKVYSGSPKFLKKLAKLIYDEIEVFAKIRKLHQNTYGLSYTCTRAKKLANWVYKGAKISLDRKFRQYLIMKQKEVVVPVRN